MIPTCPFSQRGRDYPAPVLLATRFVICGDPSLTNTVSMSCRFHPATTPLLPLFGKSDLLNPVHHLAGVATIFPSENLAVMADSFFPPRRDGNHPSGFFVKSIQFFAGKERGPAVPLLGLERLGEPVFQEFPQLGCRFELRDGIQLLERGCERIGETPDGSRPEFLISWLEVEVMHGAGKVLWNFEFALDKRLVDDHLGRHFCQFAPSGANHR